MPNFDHVETFRKRIKKKKKIMRTLSVVPK